ncbi:unnamed protein product [Phaeothamnion confervicola]
MMLCARAVRSGRGLLRKRPGDCTASGHVGALPQCTEPRRGFAIKKQPTPQRERKDSAKTASRDQTQMFVKFLDSEGTPMPELSEDEKAKNFEIGRRYQRETSTRNNAWEADMAMKIALRDEAIAALPVHLQEAALQPDDVGPPPNRRIATITPPIPGFSPENYPELCVGDR